MRKLILISICLLSLIACQWDLDKFDLDGNVYNCEETCVNGSCDEENECLCNEGWKGLNCDTILNDTSNFCETTNCNNGICNENLNVCECEEGWTGEECLTPLNIQNITFEKIFSNPKGDVDTKGILNTNDGGYLIFGIIISDSENELFAYFLKITKLGEIEWENDKIKANIVSVVEIDNCIYAIIGSTANLIKFDKIGNMTNIGQLGFSDVYIRKAQSLPNENILLIGGIFVPNKGEDLLICEISKAGSINWQRKYGGQKSDNATDAIVFNDHIFLCGFTSSNH